MSINSAFDWLHSLDDNNKRLARLHDALAAAIAREKRAEQAWQAAGERSRTLNSEVDALLRADKADAARDKLAQVKQNDADAAALEKSLRQYAALTTRLQQELDGLQAQLKQVRARLHQTGGRAAHTDVSEPQQPAAQAQTTAAEKTTLDLDTSSATMTKHADTLAANHDPVPDTERMADILKRLREKK